MSENVVIVKIAITNNGEILNGVNPATKLLDAYGELLQAQLKSLGDASRKSKATIVENIVSQTLFRGMLTQSSSTGTGGADWNVTQTGMKSLLLHVAGPAVLQSEEFNTYLSGSLGGTSVGVEGKLMLSNKETKAGEKTSQDIKVGSFTVLDTKKDSRVKYYDFASETPIDVTKQSVIEELRSAYASNPRDSQTSFQVPEENSLGKKKKTAAPKFKALSKQADKHKLRQFVQGLNRDFQVFIKNDNNYKELTDIFDAEDKKPGSADPAKIATLAGLINDRWYVSSFKNELKNLSDNGKLFDYIKSVPNIGDQFYYKSRLITIFRKDSKDNKINALLISFPRSKFINDFFGARLDGDSIKVFIKGAVEKEFLKQLGNATAAVEMNNDLAAFDAAVTELAQGKIPNKKFNYLTHEIEYLVPTGSSIPMSKAKLNYKGVKGPRPFISRKNITETPEEFEAASNYNMGTFISAEYIRLEVLKRIVEKMPEGPVGGRPLSNSILTYRTGEFANSLEIMINYRTKLARYYYNPIYYVHERTSRDPRNLISNSIREVLASKFKQAFNISKRESF